MDPKNSQHRLKEFVMQGYPENLYVYDPYVVPGDPEATERNLQKALDDDERAKYDAWKKTLLFHEQYRNFTGRSYLANYLRDRPTHFMWPADYYGQEHWVLTRETHFEQIPPEEELEPILAKGQDRILKESDPRILSEYRQKDSTTGATVDVMNMTLKVLSCVPRVFEIPNFLSPAEVQHILELAGGVSLRRSSMGESSLTGLQEETDRLNSRTSFNSWVPRERSPIIDAIYRRSADLVRIDEALLRSRSDSEYPDLPTQRSIAETLQLVHYKVGQEYTAHHDFGYTPVDSYHQEARFLTLLFYLNEGMEGGETSFPRWANAETFHSLQVTPETGKAVLFYSHLPDGNLDDFSQHAAEPVLEGEKWLINLWIWDPLYE
jgi:prolyl 4-hydroxylase